MIRIRRAESVLCVLAVLLALSACAAQRDARMDEALANPPGCCGRA